VLCAIIPISYCISLDQVIEYRYAWRDKHKRQGEHVKMGSGGQYPAAVVRVKEPTVGARVENQVCLLRHLGSMQRCPLNGTAVQSAPVSVQSVATVTDELGGDRQPISFRFLKETGQSGWPPGTTVPHPLAAVGRQ
jgi:hypothetical protein